MQLELNNILKVRYARINLDGLTVIAGENNSGKSTVGKILFSLIKASGSTRKNDEAKTEMSVRRELMAMRRLFAHSENIPVILHSIPDTAQALADGTLPPDEFAHIINRETFEHELSARSFSFVRHYTNNIKKHIDTYINPETVLPRQFDIISQSEFKEPLISFGADYGKICFLDDTASPEGKIRITLSESADTDAYMSGEFTIDDATYVESSIYMNILSSLRTFPTPDPLNPSGRKNGLPLHLTDIAEKLSAENDGILDFHSEDFILERAELKEIMNGGFKFDKRSRQLYFEQDGHIIPAVSTASGLKSFGIFQRLLENGWVSPRRILIWDEPEIHLHPEWQVKFAEMLVKLAKSGIPVVVSSHSPYFIQSLRFFSARHGAEGLTRYYLAEQMRDNSISEINDVTTDLNRVFSLLAGPLRNIMNIDEARKRHNGKGC